MDNLIDESVADVFGLGPDPWDDEPQSGQYPMEPEALTDPVEVRAVLTRPGGFILVSRSSSTRYRLRITEPKDPGPGDVRLFVGLISGGEERYDYVGTVWTAPSYYRRRLCQPGYRHGNRSTVDPGSPAARAIQWLYARVMDSDEALESALSQCEIWR